MLLYYFVLTGLLLVCSRAQNSTYSNPILPGFHPDPSCIFVPEWNNTVFCATSSFLAFPGIPIHASRDLQNWKLVSNALSRPEQLPDLSIAARATSGIWAPTLRYHKGIFYLVTTLVFDDLPKTSGARWNNFIITSDNPYNSSSWSDPLHFKFAGYDPSLFWDDDGQVYITGSHTFQIRPGIDQVPINLETGEVGEPVNIWNGAGGMAPEGPHIYKKDGYYYLMIAEGGTGEGHMVTMARSRDINGPYEPHPSNPVLTNTNTGAYFQAIGHADLFQDSRGEWWSCALAVRTGPDFLNYPMGRETVLTPVTWSGGDWPAFSNISGYMKGWELPSASIILEGEGNLVGSSDYIDFAPGYSLPPHLIHWRIPISDKYIISPPDHPYSLQLGSSVLNLTTYDGRYAGPEGQTFVGRRQEHTLFTFSANFDISLENEEQETGITAFLDQTHHFDLGIVMLAVTNDNYETVTLVPHLRFRGISRYTLNETAQMPVPQKWLGQTLTLQVKAPNDTHYTFSVGPAAEGPSGMQTISHGRGIDLSWGFTGALVGVYGTTNGRAGAFKTYISNWTYVGEGQVRE